MPLCASKGVQDTSKPYQGSGDDICETCVGTSGCTICRVSGTCVADDGIAICPMTNDPPDDHRGQNIHRKAESDVCYSNIIDNWMVNLYMVEAVFSSGSCSLTKRAQFMLKATDGTWKSVPNPFKPLQQSDSISAWNDRFELKLVAPADTEAIDLCIAPGWVGIRVDVGLSVPRIGILNSTSLNNPDSLSTCSFPGVMHAFRFAVPASPQVLALTGSETVDLTRANIKVSARDTSYNEKEHSIHLLQGGVDHSLGMICPSVSPSPNPAISGSDSSNNAGPGPSGSGPGNMGPGSSGSGSGIVGLGPSGSTIGVSSSSGSDSTIGDDGGGLNGGIIVGAVAGGLVAVMLVVAACAMLYRRIFRQSASQHVSTAGGRFSLGRVPGKEIKNLKKFNGYTGGAVTVTLDNQGDDSLRPGVSKEKWTKQLVASLGSVSQDVVIDFATVSMGKKIASGGGGQVFVARWRNTEVVVKEPFWFAGTVSQDLINEIQMLAELEHPNVVQFFGVSHADRSVYIITEYCPLGSLNDWLEQKRFPWNSFYPCACQLMHTLQWLHDSGVVHRDIKPHNILMASETSLKICDLGTCRNQVHGNQSMTANVGTLSYTPPEVMSARRAVYDGRKWDVYSASLVLFYMYTGKRPFGDRSNFQIITGVANKNGLRPEYVDCGIPDDLWRLLESMWAEDPDVRPLAGEAGSELAAISKQDALALGIADVNSHVASPTAQHHEEIVNVASGTGAWITVYDEVHGQHYYYNESTGESRWTAPDSHDRAESLGTELKTQNNPMLKGY